MVGGAQGRQGARGWRRTGPVKGEKWRRRGDAVGGEGCAGGAAMGGS